MELNKVYNEDCLEGMKNRIEDKSIDMILCDLPFQITQAKWDIIIPFIPLWQQYERVIKDKGVIALTASQPFTSALLMSNPKLFKYELIWEKEQGTGQLNAKKMPLKKHESILIFSKSKLGHMTYNPQMTEGKAYNHNDIGKTDNSDKKMYGIKDGYKAENITSRYPTSILKFNRELRNRIHKTQKPVALFEYLINTYTNENTNENKTIVLDNCMGSFTTAIACINTNRNYTGFEKDITYFNLGNNRVEEHLHNLNSAC